MRLHSAARRARSGCAPPAAPARAPTADPRRRRVVRAGRRPESFRAVAARTRSHRPKTRRATGRRPRRRRPGRLRRSAASVSRTATATARGSTGSPAASSRRVAISSARLLGGRSSGSVSSRTPSSRSPSPAYASVLSASAGRDERTRRPRSRACSTAASQSVDFPIPASPSSKSAPGASRGSSRNAATEASSRSLATTSSAISPEIVTDVTRSAKPSERELRGELHCGQHDRHRPEQRAHAEPGQRGAVGRPHQPRPSGLVVERGGRHDPGPVHRQSTIGRCGLDPSSFRGDPSNEGQRLQARWAPPM